MQEIRKFYINWKTEVTISIIKRSENARGYNIAKKGGKIKGKDEINSINS
jgi:hypothetical protein